MIRDLTSDRRPIEVNGLPVGWSPDGRFVLVNEKPFYYASGESPSYLVVEPATSNTAPLRNLPPDVSFVLYGGRPHGRPVLVDHVAGLYSSQGLRIRARTMDTTIMFAADPDDECWCPVGPPSLAPDGMTISILLRHHAGRIPGTSQRSLVIEA